MEDYHRKTIYPSIPTQKSLKREKEPPEPTDSEKFDSLINQLSNLMDGHFKEDLSQKVHPIFPKIERVIQETE